MARSKFRIDPEQYAGEKQETKTEQQAKTEEKKIKKAVGDKHYIQLNIADYKEYLDTMSKYQRKPKTKYIIELIKKDFEANKEAYEHIKAVDDLMKK